MLKVLINAYACCPDKGSEPGMAWNWCSYLAQYCELFIITEGEFKSEIEAALTFHPYKDRLHFYYNPLSEDIRKMCWNQGDWRFYKHYQKWQFLTYKIALEIIKDEQIQILHQLNMIGFREPGYLWLVPQLPFVWGPIGGLKAFPKAYLKGGGAKQRVFNAVKNSINVLQLKYSKRITKALNRSQLLISSIPNSYNALLRYKNKSSIIIPETGTFLRSTNVEKNRFYQKKFPVLWVGKFDFRKQLLLAIKSIKQTKNENIELHILGSGNRKQEIEARALVASLGITHCIFFHGNVSLMQVAAKMDMAALFFFTSVSEDTSTVVLEAISHHLPVLCFDAFGFGPLVTAEIGYKIALSTPSISIKQFADKLNYAEGHREELVTKSQMCDAYVQAYSWEKKAKEVFQLYSGLI